MLVLFVDVISDPFLWMNSFPNGDSAELIEFEELVGIVPNHQSAKAKVKAKVKAKGRKAGLNEANLNRD